MPVGRGEWKPDPPDHPNDVRSGVAQHNWSQAHLADARRIGGHLVSANHNHTNTTTATISSSNGRMTRMSPTWAAWPSITAAHGSRDVSPARRPTSQDRR